MEERPAWNDAFARDLEGAVVLIGITYDEPTGARQEQFYGTVERADAQEGIAIRLSGSRDGEWYHLPPDLRAFFPAPPGSYRLRSTGEVVIDPDFTCSWTMTPPKH